MKPSEPLSLVLGDISFAFIDAVSLPTIGAPVSQYGSFKVNKIVEDLFHFLEGVLGIVQRIEPSGTSPKLNPRPIAWYFEGKDQVIQLCRKIQEIDTLISQLLDVTNTVTDSSVVSILLSKLEDTSDLLLDTKKYLFILRKNVDIAVLYQEINHTILESLEQEIEDCSQSFNFLTDWKAPSSHPPYDLEDIITKMRINDFSYNTHNDSMKSTRLPTFSDHDREYYDEYLALIDKISPLSISLDILPHQINDFNHMAGTLFPEARHEINSNYIKLIEKWDLLNRKLANLKTECLDVKWHELFRFLIDEICLKCDKIISTTPSQSQKISSETSNTYKLCSNSITLISKAFKENIIYEDSLTTLFNDVLLTKWQAVNEILTVPAKPRTPKTVSNGGTPKNDSLEDRPSTPQKEKFGLGIDLGLDVETTTIPFSIQKKDRTKDIGNTYKKRIRYSLNLHDLAADDDDELTLVSKTPNTKYDIDTLNNNISKLRVKKSDYIKEELETFDASSFLNNLVNKLPQKPSKIPLVHAEYIQAGLPIIKKKECETTRIPTISPNHPVFHSPDRQQLKSPLRVKRESRHLDSPLRSPHNFKRVLDFEYSNSLGYRSGRSPSLKEMKVPKLNYHSLDSNNRSPERPFSSIGSRFESRLVR